MSQAYRANRDVVSHTCITIWVYRSASHLKELVFFHAILVLT